MDETTYVDNVPTGLKAASFLYNIQQQTKIPHNPAYIMILSALELSEESVINRYAKHAVQSRGSRLKKNVTILWRLTEIAVN